MRRLAAGGGAAVVAVALAIWASRPARPSWETARDHQREVAFEDPALADPAVARAAFGRVRARWGREPVTADRLSGLPGRPVWVCAHAPATRAVCAAGEGDPLSVALDAAGEALAGAVGRAPGQRLTLDLQLATSPSRWPDDPRPHDAGALGMQVGPATVLPWEVLARRLYRPPKEEAAPEWDPEALRSLLRSRGAPVGEAFALSWLRTASWVEAAPGGDPIRTYRLHAWERPDPTDPARLLQASVAAAEHLAGIVGADGRIRYRYDPGSGRELPGQNLLRHAGSVYALLQAWDRYRVEPWRAAAERALGFLLRQSRTDERTGPYGGGRVRWIAEGSHVKLGGAGLALVALSTWEASTGDPRWRTEATELGRFLVSQQQQDGEFVYFAPLRPGGEPRDQISAYYPGEAILGLMLLHALDPDPLWRDTARRGADWLIDVRDRGKGRSSLDNDHWLMIALSHLYRETRDPRYLAHALRLADAVAAQAERHAGHEAFHRDYLGGFYEPPRATPAATRAEGLIAVLDTCALAGRACPEVESLLDATLTHLMACQVAPETAFWMPDPGGAIGGFSGGVVDPELRNDFTQHALSALLGAERLRGGRGAGEPAAIEAARAPVREARGDRAEPPLPAADPGAGIGE